MKAMIIILSATVSAVGLDCDSSLLFSVGVAVFLCVLKPSDDEPHFLDVEILKDE